MIDFLSLLVAGAALCTAVVFLAGAVVAWVLDRVRS